MVSEKEIWSLLGEVNDPEVPVLSVVDLGIVREVNIGKDNARQDKPGVDKPGVGNPGVDKSGETGAEANEIAIVITPTYTGCPAMDAIRINIRMKLLEHGYPNVRLTTVLSPAWTTDWMSEKGKEKLLQYGILSALSFLPYRADQRVRQYGLQIALPLQRLRRAFRLFQMSLKY